MNRYVQSLIFALYMLVPGGPGFAQSALSDSSAPDKSSRFWERFEKDFNEFIERAIGGFIDSTNERMTAPVSGMNEAQTPSSAGMGGPPSTASESRKGLAPRIRYRASWLDENSNLSNLIVRYNRVEGIFVGLGSEKKYYWDGGEPFSPFGSVGYGFSSHRWRFDLGAARQIPLGNNNDRLLEFGVEGYTLTDSKDQWRIGLSENTAAAFLIHEDFRDYFQRDGVTFHTGYYVQNSDLFLQTKLGYSINRYTSLDDHTDWALFGGRKTFRPNPRIDDGTMNLVAATAGVSTIHGRHRYDGGWSASASAEFSNRKVLGGDFNFSQYVADIRRFQPLGRYDNLNIRLRLGTSQGRVPRQKSFELGGLGSMPAYAFKEFPGDSLGGNRMILLNMEYLVNGDFLDDLDFWPTWLLRHINLLLLADAGVVRTAETHASPFGGFGGLTWNEFRSDIGIGVANRGGTFMLGALWRTDRSEAARLLLRVAAPF